MKRTLKNHFFFFFFKAVKNPKVLHACLLISKYVYE